MPNNKKSKKAKNAERKAKRDADCNRPAGRVVVALKDCSANKSRHSKLRHNDKTYSYDLWKAIHE